MDEISTAMQAAEQKGSNLDILMLNPGAVDDYFWKTTYLIFSKYFISPR